MAPKELAQALRKQPFVPLRLTLTEGTQYEIRHPEFCLVTNTLVIIGILPPEKSSLVAESSVMVDPLHIVKMEPLEPSMKGNETQS